MVFPEHLERFKKKANGYVFLAIASSLLFMIGDLSSTFIHELGHVFAALTMGGRALSPYAHPIPFFSAAMYVSLPPNAPWLAQLWFWSAAYVFEAMAAITLFLLVLPRVKSLCAKLFSYLLFTRIVLGVLVFGCIIGVVASVGVKAGYLEAEGWLPQPGCALPTFTLLGQLPFLVPVAIGMVGIIYAVGDLFPKQAFRLFKGHFPLDTVQRRFYFLLVVIWLPYVVASIVAHLVWGLSLLAVALFSLMIPGLYDGARKGMKG